MTLQLALRPRGSRWPSASVANGPTAARITSSSPSTRAIEPPVSGATERRRSSVSCRIWSRSRPPAAALAISTISRDAASAGRLDSVSGAGSSGSDTVRSYRAVSPVRGSCETAGVDDTAPPEDAHRDQDPERGKDEDRAGGDRGVDVARLEFGVDDERQRLGPAAHVAREHDRRPELAEGASPGHDQPGRDRGTGEGQRDGEEQLPLRRAVDAGGVLVVALGRLDPGARRADEERSRHEDLGED